MHYASPNLSFMRVIKYFSSYLGVGPVVTSMRAAVNVPTVHAVDPQSVSSQMEEVAGLQLEVFKNEARPSWVNAMASIGLSELYYIHRDLSLAEKLILIG